jgi:FkbM family methyltransferase
MQREFPGAQIWSFEPSPKSFQSLAGQFGSQRGIRLENLAIGDVDGELPFTVCDEWSVNDSLLAPSWSGKTTTTTVSVTTIDSYCRKHGIDNIDWLKIDTQGYDLRVLQGAPGSACEAAIKLVSAEAMFNRMYEGQASLSDLLLFMDGCRYRVNGFTSRSTSETVVLLQCAVGERQMKPAIRVENLSKHYKLGDASRVPDSAMRVMDLTSAPLKWLILLARRQLEMCLGTNVVSFTQ